MNRVHTEFSKFAQNVACCNNQYLTVRQHHKSIKVSRYEKLRGVILLDSERWRRNRFLWRHLQDDQQRCSLLRVLAPHFMTHNNGFPIT